MARHEIVGVIGDVKSSDPRKNALPTVYQPIPDRRTRRVLGEPQVRRARRSSNYGQYYPESINQMDDKLPVYSVTTLEAQFQRVLQLEQLMLACQFLWCVSVVYG